MPPTGLRSSTRARRRISYAEPSTISKLRQVRQRQLARTAWRRPCAATDRCLLWVQGDPFTFGTAQGWKKKPRSRTKPRARHTQGGSSAKRWQLDEGGEEGGSNAD